MSSSNNNHRRGSTNVEYAKSIRRSATRHNRSNPNNVFQERIVVVMVGLPARGKSYLSKTMVRYGLSVGCPTKLFNAGNARRTQGLAGTDASFFDPKNANATQLREQMAMECLETLLEWIQRPTSTGGCSLGILDATNTTKARRQKVMDRCCDAMVEDPYLQVLFVESWANDPVLLEQNYRMKLANDDYKGQDPEKAMADFRERVVQYEAVYEELEDDEFTEKEGQQKMKYIKLINAGEKLICKGIEGYVMRKLQRLLGSVHLGPRTIWLALCGETENEDDEQKIQQGLMGGDPELSDEGIEYAFGVAEFIKQREVQVLGPKVNEVGHGDLTVFTGTSKRYVEMADLIVDTHEHSHHGEDIDTQVLTTCLANDICRGTLDSTTRQERLQHYPKEEGKRQADKLNYRYPGVGGESYQDLLSRLHEVLMLLEASRGNSLVICDCAVYRVVMGYFLGNHVEEIPHLQVKSGVLEMTRTETGFQASHIPIHEGKSTRVTSSSSTANNISETIDEEEDGDEEH